MQPACCGSTRSSSVSIRSRRRTSESSSSSAKRRLPAIYGSTEFVGGLATYGVEYTEMYRRAAGFVDKISKGATPSELPVEEPTKFELIINIKTAKTLGLTIAPSLLLRADRILG